MIVGIGIDVIYVERIEKAMLKKGFLEYIFSKEELDKLFQKGFVTQSIAGAFCAKEAVSKALGTGIGMVRWHNIQIFKDFLGKPYCVLKGNAKNIFENTLFAKTIYISITHEKNLAFAQAIIEK